MGIWYCTREDVKSALDFKETARNNVQVDRAIEAASRSVDKLCHRTFFPWTGTRYFRWPDESWGAPSWRLWLDDDELISISELQSGGVSIDVDDTFLEPANSGPPFNQLQLNQDSSGSFGGGNTPQRDIAVTGVFGYCADEETIGTNGAVDASTTVLVSNGATVGVGDLIRIGAERMIVTGRSWLSLGTTSAPLGNAKSNTTLVVVDGSLFNENEIVLIDSEKMLITDVAGNNLMVQRAWDGSVLAAHDVSTPIFLSRTLTVTRGALGTVAVVHLEGTAYKHLPPGPVRSLTIAEAISQIEQESSGYGRTVGSGDNQREARGAGLGDLRQEVYDKYGRKARIRSV